MTDKIECVLYAWVEQIDSRNAYKFGETAIDLRQHRTNATIRIIQ